MQKLTMKQLPKEDRPYEKCLESGATSLTDAELLAVIIRTGSREETSLELARQILSLEGQENRLLGLLHHSLEDYCRIKGVGKVKGAQLMCIGELSRRIWNCKARETPVSFTHPEQIADYYYGRYAPFRAGGDPGHVLKYKAESDPGPSGLKRHSQCFCGYAQGDFDRGAPLPGSEHDPGP